MTLQEFYTAIGGDYNDVMARLMNSTKLVDKFVRKFPTDHSYQDMIDGITNSDWELAFRGSHSLKGVAASLAFTKLAKASSELCEMFRGNKVNGDYAGLLADTSAAYEEAIANIAKLD